MGHHVLYNGEIINYEGRKKATELKGIFGVF